MFASLAMLASGAVSGAELAAACRGKDGWIEPAPPAHIIANVYDVGTCGITVLLVVLNSHEHHDHAGGIAELQRLSGATLVARAPVKAVLESGVGDPADPQAAILDRFPGAKVGRVIGDGGQVTLGGTALTAHATPGHAAGSTSWTWRACEGRRCVRVVYADSLTAVSGDGYRFSDHPGYVTTFRATLAKVGAMPCDLLITPHPSVSRFFERLSGAEPLIETDGCRRYAAAAVQKLDTRLAEETQ